MLDFVERKDKNLETLLTEAISTIITVETYFGKSSSFPVETVLIFQSTTVGETSAGCDRGQIVIMDVMRDTSVFVKKRECYA
jgi:hypothetical protein